MGAASVPTLTVAGERLTERGVDLLSHAWVDGMLADLTRLEVKEEAGAMVRYVLGSGVRTELMKDVPRGTRTPTRAAGAAASPVASTGASASQVLAFTLSADLQTVCVLANEGGEPRLRVYEATA